MATTPLTVVEGAMALPRSRPFNDVPAPFGCGWALLAPGYCLDSRLHGLYGAVLKTFNLNEQPIRSFCRWVAPENRRAAAAAAAGVAAVIGERVVDSGAAGRAAVLGAAGGGGSVGSVGSVGSFHNANSAIAAAFADSVSADAAPSAETLPRAEAPGSSEAFAPVATHTSEAERHAPRAPLLPWRMLAGAACALSGVALVAWLAPRHDDASHQGDGKDMRSFQHGAVRNMTTAQAPSLAGAGAAKNSGEATHVTVMTATPTAQSEHAAAAPAPATVRATAIATATGAEPAPARVRTMLVEEATPNKETTTQITTRAPQTAPTVRIPKQAVARNDDHRRSARRGAASATALSRRHEAAGHAANLAANLTVASPASRRFVKPSVAGSYSPLAPSPLGIDDYASVDLSANTRSIGRSQRAQSQPPSFAPSSPDSGQQWMSRLSQRRVTEVPDQFIR